MRPYWKNLKRQVDMTLGELLKEEIKFFAIRSRTLMAIANLVKQHPEWIEQEPKLVPLLEELEKVS